MKHILGSINMALLHIHVDDDTLETYHNSVDTDLSETSICYSYSQWWCYKYSLCYLQSVVVIVVVAEPEGDNGDKQRQAPPNQGVHSSFLEPETTTIPYL